MSKSTMSHAPRALSVALSGRDAAGTSRSIDSHKNAVPRSDDPNELSPCPAMQILSILPLTSGWGERQGLSVCLSVCCSVCDDVRGDFTRHNTNAARHSERRTHQQRATAKQTSLPDSLAMLAQETHNNSN